MKVEVLDVKCAPDSYDELMSGGRLDSVEDGCSFDAFVNHLFPPAAPHMSSPGASSGTVGPDSLRAAEEDCARQGAPAERRKSRAPRRAGQPRKTKKHSR
jgi:hypothetical protein